MNKFMLLSLSLFFVITKLNAQKLETNVLARSCVFYHPHEGNYVETYFSIPTDAVRYHKNKYYQYEAAVEVQIFVMDGANVSSFDKYKLNFPVASDTSSLNQMVFEQKRLMMPDKASTLELKITDVYDSTNVFYSTESILPMLANMVQVSDIEFVDSYNKNVTNKIFEKNKIEIIPYTINFFPSSVDTLRFYGEIYQTLSKLGTEPFLVTYSIRANNSDKQLASYYQYDKFTGQEVISFLKEFPINELPSGNYNLVVEVRSKSNELIAQKKTFFQRTNKVAVNYYDNISLVNITGTFVDTYSDEQLNYFLAVIRPRASSDEIKLIESLTPRVDSDMKKKFLYNFWLERNLADPYAEWLAYLKLVQQVNDNFGTTSKEGYRTDRGRVYLQYGPPSDRLLSVNESGAYPYEIWFYNQLPDKQTQIGFAFYEPSMVTNDYVLLHSNARGELHDERWKIKIYENVASKSEMFDFDNTEVSDKLGGQRPIDIYKF